MSLPAPQPPAPPAGQRHFFTGPIIKTELLLEWLDQHGVTASTADAEVGADPDDLSREMHVFVAGEHYDRAYQLFFAEREDEI
jgi:hypothetical protein